MPRSPRLRTAFLLSLGWMTGLVVAPALAQVPPGQTKLSTDLAPLHPLGLPGSEPVAPITAGHYALGALFTFDDRPIRELPAADQGVRARWLSELYATYGPHERLSLGLTLPWALAQQSSGVELEGDPTLGDLRLRAKVLLLPTSDFGGFGLSLLPQLDLPTSSSTRALLGESSLSGGASLLSELRMLLITLHAQLGYHYRRPGRVLGQRQLAELPLAFGLRVKPQLFGWDQRGRWLANVHIRGAVQSAPQFAAAPFSRALAGATVRYSLGDVQLTAGVESAVAGRAGAPRWRALLGLQYAPTHFDADSDGIVDELDFCPDQPEDLDGDVDGDGCPEGAEDLAPRSEQIRFKITGTRG